MASNKALVPFSLVRNLRVFFFWTHPACVAAAVFVAIVAACQMIAGTIVGDWMHTSQIVKSFDDPVGAAWLEEQEAIAWRFAADILDGWGVPNGGVSEAALPLDKGQLSSKLLGDQDDAADDDGGLIPAGGAKIATEYGLWGACVWSKTFSQAEQKTRETFMCKTYTELHDGAHISDDAAGKIAPTPSSANFGAAQALSVIACVGVGISLLASIVAMFVHGNTSPPKADERLLGGSGTADDDLEEVDKWCTTGGVPFPTTGVAGRLVVVSAVCATVGGVAAFGALGAWADSQAAGELQQQAANSHGVIEFAMGSAMLMVGLGGGFAVIHVIMLVLGYLWFRDNMIINEAENDHPSDGPLARGDDGEIVGSLQAAGLPASKADALETMDDDGKV